jgi:O-antigen ligase
MWILLAMIVVMPFERNPYLYLGKSVLGVLPDLTVIKLLGMTGLAWSLFLAIGGRVQLNLLNSAQARAFMAFCLLTLTAAMASGWQLADLTRLLAVACLLPLVAAVVLREGDLWRVAKILVIVMILVFPYAVRQQLRFGGRLGVGLYEPNYTALALLIPIPVAFAIAHHEPLTWKRRLWFLAACLLVLQLVMTGSRGGFLGLIVVLGLAAFRLTKRRLLAIVTLGLVLLGIVSLPTTLSERLHASVRHGGSNYGLEASNEARLSVAKAGLRMALANPLTGVGLGQFRFVTTQYGATQEKIAHMTYIEIAAELGFPALTAFVWTLYATLRSLGRSRRLLNVLGKRDLAGLSTALQVGLIGWIVSAAFLSAQYEKLLWLTIALSICIERQASAPLQAPRDAHDHARLWDTVPSLRQGSFASHGNCRSLVT